jgi:hypothetical protein
LWPLLYDDGQKVGGVETQIRPHLSQKLLLLYLETYLTKGKN